jgi:hypothetical protein
VNEWTLYSFIGYRVCYFVFQVYAGVTELSFEELRAIEYLKGNRPARCIQGRKMRPAIVPLFYNIILCHWFPLLLLFEVSVLFQELSLVGNF